MPHAHTSLMWLSLMLLMSTELIDTLVVVSADPPKRKVSLLGLRSRAGTAGFSRAEGP